MKNELHNPIWETFATEPRYPTNNLAYVIDTTQAPTTGNREGQHIVHTVEGVPLILWKSTFIMLADIVKKNNYKTTKVAFSRAPNSKITLVRQV